MFNRPGIQHLDSQVLILERERKKVDLMIVSILNIRQNR